MDFRMSYLFGFLQADGSFCEQSRNRGKIRLEVSYRDKDVIYLLDDIIPCNSFISERTRNTNFKDDYKSICLTICDFEFREKMKMYGLPVGKKSHTITPPTINSYSEVDYIRGLFDGDGSLGITSNNIPFVSIITASEKMKDYILDFFFRETGKLKKSSRNKRDGVFNIMITNEDAQKFVKDVYYDGCIALNRKKEKARQISEWVRPEHVKKRN